MASRPDTRNGTGAGNGLATGTALDSSREHPGRATPAAGTTDAFVGRVFSHYRLEQRLGAGGMAVVYRGTDLALGRAVAIKLLARHLVRDETAKSRFVQEARAASALDHPNIANVHDIGEADGELFIVMALYDGETLQRRMERGCLPLDEAVGILRQVALGLEAAHRAGIVHRDIKPANIVITSAGAVKILDFGVAKLVGESQAQLTQTGQQIGTMLYMSPEQLGGASADARSDLWSLGLLAHEMLAGASPFRADSAGATAARILKDEPPSLATVPGVPDWFAQLVSQLLEKDPARRPQSASEVLQRLSHAGSDGAASAMGAVIPRKPAPPVEITTPRLSGPRGRAVLTGAVLVLGAVALYFVVQRRDARTQVRAVKSLAVLPFSNASANADMEYLSDGIAESLIDNLSQIPELRVLARNTAFRAKGKEGDLQKLGRELSVDAVLTGRVQQRGDTLTVHADLVHTETGAELWGDKYNRKLNDLVSVEEEIAGAISDKLRPRLTSEVQRRVTKLSTGNPEAYRSYLRGRYVWNKRTKEGLTKAIEYFERAIELDPTYALAWAGLADAHSLLAYYAYAPWKGSYAKAEAAALKALSLDDQLAEAHAALGNLRMENWEFSSAEKELKQAIALNPNYATAHNWYGLYLNWTGHLDEARAEFTRSLQLDPASPLYGANLGGLLCQLGQYDRGIAQVKESLQLDEDFGMSRFMLAGICYLPSRMYREAIDECKRIAGASPANPLALAALAGAYAASGERDRAMSILNQVIERDGTVDLAVMIGHVYFSLGDRERGFEWFEKAYQRHSHTLIMLKVAPLGDSVRSDPRFVDLLRRIGFPP